MTNLIGFSSGGSSAKLDEAIETLFENGGLPATPFKTKALMTASALVDGDYAQVTDDTVNNGLYVKTEGVWVKSNYDPVLLANQYTDSTAGTALTTTSNLNILKAGNYYLTTANLNAIVDDGTYAALGYPTSTKKGGPVKISVVVAPPSNYSVQSLEFISQGTRFSRQGSVGGSYQPWSIVDGGIITTNTYTTIAEGMAATKHNDDLFWVYPNTDNTLKQLTLFKRLTSQTQAIVFEQSTINEYLIEQGAKWEQ